MVPAAQPQPGGCVCRGAKKRLWAIMGAKGWEKWGEDCQERAVSAPWINLVLFWGYLSLWRTGLNRCLPFLSLSLMACFSFPLPDSLVMGQ